MYISHLIGVYSHVRVLVDVYGQSLCWRFVSFATVVIRRKFGVSYFTLNKARSCTACHVVTAVSRRLKLNVKKKKKRVALWAIAPSVTFCSLAVVHLVAAKPG